jgi:8-oxo-dGTP pyrophosphatase MutT (NUDIX family)
VFAYRPSGAVRVGHGRLPGGWADPGEASSAAVTREVLEETGYPSSAVKLMACWDRELQDNPPPLPVNGDRRGHST